MIILSRRSVVAGMAAACSVATAGPVVGQTAAVDPVPHFTLGHGIVRVTRVRTPRDVVAMTFDDGPHPSNTPRLLDILRERQLRATFYLIGAMVASYPDIARRIVDEGHEVGNHTWRHPFLSSLGDESVLREIDRTTEVIWQATRAIPHTLRPPYGAITAGQTTMIHSARNLPTVMWSVDTQDWRRPGAAVVASRVIDGADRGAIILAHDIHAPTIDAMPRAMDGLIARGFTSITMSELLGFPPDSDRFAAAAPNVAGAVPPLQ